MRRRSLLLLGAAAFWFLVLVLRLAYLQVERHDEYRSRAEGQHQRVVELDPPRGTVFDRHGQKLAVSVEVDSAFAVPAEVPDPEATAAALAGLLGEPAERYREALGRDREFVWIARKLDPPVAARLRELDLPGIDFLSESKRYYPNRELAGALLGFVGTDNAGLAGLEAAWDDLVAGRAGRQTVLRDARRGTVVVPDLAAAPPEPGADLVLTIDAALQHVAERELAAAVSETRASGGSVVLLDPRSGAVLALASAPGFDPNRFASYDESTWRDRAVMNAYEPGSTFKIFTVAASLEHQLLDPSDVFDCGMGSITLAGIRIRDHKPFGELTVREVLAMSSNVGAIKVGLTVGRERLYEEIRQFGFGRPTGIALPGESAGLLRELPDWRPLTTAYVSFGQGISVTPLQLATAVAAVANGGTLLRPHLVAAVRHAGGIETRPSGEIVGRPISPATALTLERMMEEVVERGTGKAAAVPGYRVAGKTGTAQKAVPGIGYAANRYVASFVGFAPARDPRLVGLVVIDEPRGGRYHGGQVAAPVFSHILARALPLMGIPPDHERQLTPPDEGAASETVRRARLDGDGPLSRDDVPDFTGLTAREVVRRSAAAGVRVELNGTGGFVARQSPLPGTRRAALGDDQPIRLWLGRG